MGLLDGISFGGSSSSGSGKTQTSAPWKPAQKPMQLALTDAEKAYKSGVGSQVYTGSTVIPYAQQSIQGFDSQMKAAKAAMPGLQTGFNHMADVAGGKFLNANQYLDPVIQQNAQDITRAQQMASSGAGRYGSGGYQAVTQNQIGRMANDARLSNYQTERAAQDAAAAGGMQTAYAGTLAPGSTMRDVGAQYEDLATRQKQDELRIWDAKQNQPWDQIARLSGVSDPKAGTGSVTTAQGPSRFQSALGGAIGGYQIGGAPGAAVGALGGYYQ